MPCSAIVRLLGTALLAAAQASADRPVPINCQHTSHASTAGHIMCGSNGYAECMAGSPGQLVFQLTPWNTCTSGDLLLLKAAGMDKVSRPSRRRCLPEKERLPLSQAPGVSEHFAHAKLLASMSAGARQVPTSKQHLCRRCWLAAAAAAPPSPCAGLACSQQAALIDVLGESVHPPLTPSHNLKPAPAVDAECALAVHLQP